jgi:hypothetical protein
MIEFEKKNIDLGKLKEPFKRVHFRPKTCYNGKVLLLAYIDSRDVMKRLDDIIGPQYWECDYKEIKNNLYCGIGINNIWKWDCGTESNQDAEKGESSDAFKRAAVKWGVGRYLYYLPTFRVDILNSGTNYIKIEDKKTKEWIDGYYNIPKLPDWAYPKIDKEKQNENI